jgi:predicted heme/steroid binding protein
VLTQRELAQFDGTDQKKPIYIAVKGEIFDVSRGSAYYAKGGAYGFFSGKDASRAYTTGCFQTHLTHDLRGLSPQQLEVRSGLVKCGPLSLLPSQHLIQPRTLTAAPISE